MRASVLSIAALNRADGRHALAIRQRSGLLQELQPLPFNRWRSPLHVGHVARATLTPVTVDVARAVQEGLGRVDPHHDRRTWHLDDLIQASKPANPQALACLEVDEEEAPADLPHDIAHRQRQSNTR